jgi:nucleoside-diphosphate-sugar epimerase
LPPAFNRSRWAAEWKGHRYSNKKMKELLGWRQKVPTAEAMNRYFEYAKQVGGI